MQREPEMIQSRGDGIALRLAVWEGRGGPLLCVHGLTANSRCWDSLAAGLAGDYRLLAPDLRGRGLSDKPDTGYSEAHHVRDLLCLLDDLSVPRAAIVGHSLGAYICLAFAARHPERVSSLILMDGGGDLDPAQWDRVEAAIKPAVSRLDQVYPSTEAFLDLMRQAPFLKPWNAAIETYFRYDLTETPGGVRSRIQAAHIREETANVRATAPASHYPRLACPALILRAPDGILTPDDILLPPGAVSRMLREIPAAQCVDVPGTNHYTILFRQSAIRDDAIRRFLGSLSP